MWAAQSRVSPYRTSSRPLLALQIDEEPALAPPAGSALHPLTLSLVWAGSPLICALRVWEPPRSPKPGHLRCLLHVSNSVASAPSLASSQDPPAGSGNHSLRTLPWTPPSASYPAGYLGALFLIYLQRNHLPSPPPGTLTCSCFWDISPFPTHESPP